MKKILPAAFVIFFALLLTGCAQPTASGSKKYLARFEVDALCANYTFSVISNIDTAWVMPEWTNPQTGKTYKNAFAINNPCALPAELKVGDQFYFIIDTTPPKADCAVCMAYYPTPEKKLNIKVVK